MKPEKFYTLNYPLIVGASLTPDTLRFLLPALCHLVAEDKPRKIVMDMKLHETMHTYLAYHWSIFDSFKSWLQQQVHIRSNILQVAHLFLSCFIELG